MAGKRREGSYSPVKIIFQVIQCLHHLSLLSDQGAAGSSRQAFSRKVKELNSFIRPAIPNSDVIQSIQQVNRTWATSVVQVLVNHYRTQLDFLRGSLSGWKMSSADRVLYRNKALQWARQNFGKKLKNDTIQALDNLLADVCKLPVKNTKDARDTNACPETQQISQELQPQRASASEGGDLVAPSTPGKRRRSSSPTGGQTPKRTCTTRKSLHDLYDRMPTTKPVPQTARPASYSAAAKSPPLAHSRTLPATKTKKDPVVHRFPRNDKKRGQQIHEKWEIPKVKKDILILGASNLARITVSRRSDAQIVSYPGLRLDHLLRLLQGFKYGTGSQDPGLKPSKVVINVGINDRERSISTNDINLKKVLNRLVDVFPGSKIFMLLNQYSDKLRENDRTALGKLNDSIVLHCSKKENVDFIRQLAPSKFQVSPNDYIHWTEQCANTTLEHIFRHLN